MRFKREIETWVRIRPHPNITVFKTQPELAAQKHRAKLGDQLFEGF